MYYANVSNTTFHFEKEAAGDNVLSRPLKTGMSSSSPWMGLPAQNIIPAASSETLDLR